MNNSLTLCVDASVIVRHVTSDAIKQRWEKWMKVEAKIVAPTLLYYEVTNGLYRYQKAGILPPEAVAKALIAVLALPIELVSNTELHHRAREVAVLYSLSATYDAHYLALAQWMDVELWTVDIRLVNSLKLYKLSWVKRIE
ncbi:MAG: type II toxin-antitoxin system VapC family toxin [Anaerolineae bacterium]|nr:type II toxin-antitoxin system VapC family toxin [Anaerolineae bacterium]